ncbi:phage distal tail protein [Fibrobacter sp.]|uniref:phage distal tail protein n=1 Tax=Fibrobacter sp. TaxID=35828 RepID=UPI00388D0AF5
MNIDQIETKCFILALFIREDGERFLLGSGAYDFKDSQLHFVANEYKNDIVEVQGDDGLLLAGQVRRSSKQDFDGYIGDATVKKPDVENYRTDFLAFFRKDFYYTVVYIFPDGTAIQRRKGFIVDAPEVKELYQFYPEYHVALNFEDINYYSYSENEEGEEIYMMSALIPVSAGGSSGGLVWDSVGNEWDSVGSIWEESGTAGPTTISVGSIDNVYPMWEIKGPANNPQLTSLTAGITLTYTGNVNSGQTLIIDMFNKTAKLDNTSVINNISGDWVYFKPGDNRVTYTTINQDSTPSTIYWQEVVG